jgi:hypothetical protein
MRIEDFNVLPAHVSFSRGNVRVFLEDGNYLVKFFRGENIYVGEIHLDKLEWGAFPHNDQLEDWRIEFWDESYLVYVHYHLIHGSNILFIPQPKSHIQPMVEGLIEECKKVQEMGGIAWTFFEGCYRFRDLLDKENIKTFEFGKDLYEEFPYIIEKKY